MKHPWISRISAGVCALLAAVCLTPSVRAADAPYASYHYDRFGDAVPSRAGYLPERSVSGKELGISDLNIPNDLFRDAQNRFYIADTGNHRIVIVDENWTRAISVLDTFFLPDGNQTTLKNPRGIYVSPQTGLLYIADSDHSRVLICDAEGNVRSVLEKPTSALYDQDLTFSPQKVLADKAGNVYVILTNTTSGAVTFDAKGNFTGYYGANRVEATDAVVKRYLRNLFSAQEMLDRTQKSVPSAFTNFDLDADGFVYTVSSSSTQVTDRVKKVNAAGDNLFSDLDAVWGDPFATYYGGKLLITEFADLDIGDDATIHCLDYTTGRVFQYDEECNLLFLFGTKSDQLGGFDQPTAIETAGERVYVLDAGKNTVTIFRQTEFGALVQEANHLYNAGYYEEALAPWNEVLRQDGSYRRAYIGIANAMLTKRNYKAAMRYAKLADSSACYDKAFEGWRSEFLRAHFGLLLGAAAALCLGGVAICHRRRRKKRGDRP